ncbi:MAG: hypothetical protein K8I01_11535 [Candidatus Methylomirabilis sp.]|nr:hypothetical protein [Deltaproteobacteria bacterium]
MPPKHTLAEIVQESSFTEQFDSISTKYKRLEDVHAGLDWALARDPKQGTVVDGKIRVFKTTAVGETPGFWVLYKYDEEAHKVHYLALKPIQSKEF